MLHNLLEAQAHSQLYGPHCIRIHHPNHIRWGWNAYYVRSPKGGVNRPHNTCYTRFHEEAGARLLYQVPYSNEVSTSHATLGMGKAEMAAIVGSAKWGVPGAAV